MEQKKYRVAVIGCGNIGADVARYSDLVQPATHAGAFSVCSRTELVALVDIDEEKLARAKKYFPTVPTFRSVAEMMAACHPDIVSIATPVRSHGPLVFDVAAFPVKLIVCEKPIATTVAEAKEMIRVCREKNIPLCINHTRRFDPLVRQARERLQELGVAVQARIFYYRGLHNNGTHFMDLLRFFLGDVVSVYGIRNARTESFTDLPGDQNMDGILCFASGARAVIQSLDSDHFSNADLEILCARGRLALRHFGFRIEYTPIENCVAFAGHRELAEKKTEIVGTDRSLMISLANHVADVLDGKTELCSRGEDGLAALSLIEALETSAREKRFIEL